MAAIRREKDTILIMEALNETTLYEVKDF